MSTELQPLPVPETGRLNAHRVDTVALVFGVMFATIGLAALAQQLHWVHLHGRTWFGVAIVALGLAGVGWVVSAALRPRRA